MRTLASLLAACAASTLCACSVPDKQPITGDSGVDGQDQDPNGTPETRITTAPDEFSNVLVATFEFESSKPGSRFECSINGDPPSACTSPFARNLTDGTHSFSVRAISASNDPDPSPAEHLWLIDTVAPITTITEAPAVADNSTMAHFGFMGNEMNLSFECALDGAAFAPCRNGDEFGPIGDGAHTFQVRAVDRAGNFDASPAIHTWSVDTSTPDTTLLSGPMGATVSPSATFTFLSPDAGPGATFECSIDGSAFAACTSPAEYGGLEMGVHTFAVRVRDATGNFDPTPATRTWTIDLTPPETTITDGPSGTIAMASASISFTSNEADVTYACSLDGGAFAACTSPFNATMLPQGAHTFLVQATDIAGHTDASPASASWTVDTVTPGVTFTTGPNNGDTTGPRVTFAWVATEGTVECRFDTEAAWMPCASPITFNGPNGTNDFYLRATDAAGNVTTVNRFWEVACAAPDTTGAVGLLHFEEATQIQVNATGGANATLGPTDQVEISDPAVQAARFGLGLELAAGEGDFVAWPAALGATGAFTIDLWARPDPVAGTRDVFLTGDGRVAIRVAADTADTVRFSATVIDDQGVMHTVTSASYVARQWHQVVVSLSEPTLLLWVDGDRASISNARVGAAPSFDSLRIGGSMVGGIDEVWLAQGSVTSDDTVLARYCPWLETRL